MLPFALPSPSLSNWFMGLPPSVFYFISLFFFLNPYNVIIALSGHFGWVRVGPVTTLLKKITILSSSSFLGYLAAMWQHSLLFGTAFLLKKKKMVQTDADQRR